MSSVENINEVEANVRQLDALSKRIDLGVREKRVALEQIEPATQKRPCLDANRPETSRYYLYYVSEEQYPIVPFQKLFGMPRTSYIRLLMDLKRNCAFQVWYRKNHNTEKEPIELLLLAALRALKNARTNQVEDVPKLRADNFVDFSPMTYIAPDILLQFYDYLLSYGFNVLYSKYVESSSFVITADMLEHMNVFLKVGLFGVLETKMKKRIRELRTRAA
jgi:hypothetical protein